MNCCNHRFCNKEIFLGVGAFLLANMFIFGIILSVNSNSFNHLMLLHASGFLMSLLISMITFMTVSKNRFEQKASTDALTGLANRDKFNEELKKQFLTKKNERIHVLLMDLDRFKTVNDTLGHPVGDQLLIQVSHRLTDLVRKDIDLVSRLGGDEFSIIIIDDEFNNSIIDRIIQSIEQPFMIDGHTIQIGISIGLATAGRNDTDIDIVRKADVAMYVAKHDHIKFAEYDVAKDCNTIDFLTMPYAITNAIKKNEFELYYQPKMCLKTSKIVGVESLIRWNHQSGRVIPPSMFIEFAEKTGLIRELTEWIIKETVLTNAKLQELGIDIDISINISANNLNDPEIMVAISTALSDNNICPENLILEVTETAIMSDPDMSIKILVSLESLGIKLSLDDFGTGHSSFLYLKYIPLREIKIDRSFIKDIHTSQHDMSIVKSTIGLAHEMGCVVVAEGVETQEVEDLLRELDCDLAQGYHILPPVPFDSLVEWFKENGGYNE